jgi:hypothetical protein
LTDLQSCGILDGEGEILVLFNTGPKVDAALYKGQNPQYNISVNVAREIVGSLIGLNFRVSGLTVHGTMPPISDEDFEDGGGDLHEPVEVKIEFYNQPGVQHLVSPIAKWFNERGVVGGAISVLSLFTDTLPHAAAVVALMKQVPGAEAAFEEAVEEAAGF